MRWSTATPCTCSRRWPSRWTRCSAHVRRPLTLIAESDLNDPKLINPREAGGYGLTAQWNDDFHHVLHVALTGETDGYYADFGPMSAIAKVMTGGLLPRRHVLQLPRPRPRPAGRHPADARAGGSSGTRQDHDQIGNRAAGDRLTATSSPADLAIAAVLVLTGPFTPMLFMGEEWAASHAVAVLHLAPGRANSARPPGRAGWRSSPGWAGTRTWCPTRRPSRRSWIPSWTGTSRRSASTPRCCELYRDLVALRRVEAGTHRSPVRPQRGRLRRRRAVAAGRSFRAADRGELVGRAAHHHPAGTRRIAAAGHPARSRGQQRAAGAAAAHRRGHRARRRMTGRRASGQAGSEPVRWLFGDQLGPHFLDSDDQRVLLIESRKVFARRRFHRQKAHLVLSAMRHRAAELGDRCEYRTAATYSEVLRDRPAGAELSVCHPTSYAARDLVRAHCPECGCCRLADSPPRWPNSPTGRTARGCPPAADGGPLPAGPAPTGRADGRRRAGRRAVELRPRQPAAAAQGRPRRTPVTGVGVPDPWWPGEDEIDERGARATSTAGSATASVASSAATGRGASPPPGARRWPRFEHFVDHRLTAFGPYEDAMLAGDPWMAHSLLFSPDEPRPARSARGGAAGRGRLPRGDAADRARGGVRPPGHRLARLHLAPLLAPRPELPRPQRAARPAAACPQWFAELDADAVEARCLSSSPGRGARTTAGCTTSRG